MKILRLLNKINLSIFLFLFITQIHSIAEENPVDIWNIDKEQKNQKLKNEDKNKVNNENIIKTEPSIYDLQNQKEISKISLDKEIISQDIKIIGLYDPDDYDLSINMWTNSNGDQLKNIFSNLKKINLSNDAKELMNISILTNAYYPKNNITNEEFTSFKSDWLIKNSDLELIEEYIIKNQAINLHPNLSKYFVDQHLSTSNLKDACRIFLNNTEPINDDYLSKFNIYCLVNEGKFNEAQLILDLKKELGFKDDYFEKKIGYLIGYNKEIVENISEKSILDFHLAYVTNPNFSFEPKESTKKIIWKYLSSNNLLYDVKEIDITELDKIALLEKATHNKNYPENDLFEIYKRFQFNINQLLNAKNSYKFLKDIEARALIYQKILLESETEKKIELIKILKDLFINEGIENSFDNELRRLLDQIEYDEIPNKFISFYKSNIKSDEENNKKIKFNNDILHQSKLVNYFNGDYSKSKVEKDVNNFLKKIKKNKKYFLSKKDIIFLETLKSDGIKIQKKFNDLYEINDSEIPTDIQVMINNNEMGAALLRIVEVIGQDNLERIDDDTMYFIISTFNQLDIDLIRNRILLKVLPLKV